MSDNNAVDPAAIARVLGKLDGQASTESGAQMRSILEQDFDATIETDCKGLNQNAHNSFSTMFTTISIARSKPEDWQPRIKKHVEHWQKYVEYLNHIEQLFRAGRKKEDVLQAITNMHRSNERWKEVSREQARNPVPPVKLLKVAFLSKHGKWRYLVVDQPPGKQVRFRVHIDERRYASKDNMVVIRTGTETEMLEAFDSDYQAAVKEGWQIEQGQ